MQLYFFKRNYKKASFWTTVDLYPPKLEEKFGKLGIYPKHMAPTLLSHYGSLGARKKVKSEEPIL